MTFEDKTIVALQEEDVGSGSERYDFLLTPSEEVLIEYKSVRDRLIFTDKRIISIDIQGLRGKKAEFFILPYSKVSAFSVETAGTFDIDSEFKVWASGLGMLQFEFLKGTDVKKLAQILSSKLL
ncbi:PH domain-containing protein [Endozoicomonas ascidiicola]|uniref:PH domain-containing protein n=1 Tax=Endozoicomonas ascidiicola TaxID=1698521 RepID=UPI00083742EB|nr:PH domain-containing protein [Endozoicomonas ascidiicola]